MKKIIALIICALSAGGASTTGTGTIAVHVTDQDGNPLIGAAAMVVGTSYGAMSDAQGIARIQSLPAGDYSLRVQMVGLGTVELSASVADGETTNVSAVLSYWDTPPSGTRYHEPDTLVVSGAALMDAIGSEPAHVVLLWGGSYGGNGPESASRLSLGAEPGFTLAPAPDAMRLFVPDPFDIEHGGLYMISTSSFAWRFLPMEGRSELLRFSSSPLLIPPPEPAASPLGISAVGDFDGDGEQDTLVRDDFAVLSYLGVHVPTPEPYSRLLLLSLNPDGDKDDDLLCELNRSLYLLSMDDCGRWVSCRVSPEDSTWSALAAFDIDEDGREELLVRSEERHGYAGLLLALKKDAWEVVEQFPLVSIDGQTGTFRTDDFDYDEEMDLLQAANYGAYLYDIEDESGWLLPLSGYDNHTISPVPADVDMDGRVELLAVSNDSLICWELAYARQATLVLAPFISQGYGAWDGDLEVNWFQAGATTRPVTSVSISFRTGSAPAGTTGAWSDWIDILPGGGSWLPFDDVESVELRIRLETEDPACTPVVSAIRMARTFPLPPGVVEGPYIHIPM